MKKWIFSASALGLIAVLLLVTACGQYGDTLPGQRSVVTKGAGWMSEGGGVMDSVFSPGCYYLASGNVQVSKQHYSTGLQYLWLRNLQITMTKNKDGGSIIADVAFLVQLNPTTLTKTYANFKTWDTKILSIGETVSKNVFSKYDISIGQDSSGANVLAKRSQIAEQIRQGILKQFAEGYPEFKDIFFLHAVIVGNVRMPEKIQKAIANVAVEKYNLDLAKIDKDIAVLEQEVKAEETRNDLDALGTESGNMSPALLNFMSQDLLTALMTKNKGPVKLIIVVDKNGNPTMFKQ